MDDVVDISQYFKTCENCQYSNGTGVCQRPGGWWFDAKFRHCATFQKKEGKA